VARTPSEIAGKYVGNELQLFQAAHNWKRYLASRLRPYVVGDVLEVGAGLGTNIPYLYRDTVTRWCSLEPDPDLCAQYRSRKAEEQIPARCELVQGTLQDLPEEQTFNSILYVDVLEHIRDDKAEFEQAYQRLCAGGHLSVLCPAHSFLFSPFDKAIGHYRRYNKRMYADLSPHPPLVMEYLDCVGMIASVANRLLLRQPYPTEKQIRLWDGAFVPLSRIADPWTFRSLGKSILGVWQK
jgi:SAM-dependent methyltransferase